MKIVIKFKPFFDLLLSSLPIKTTTSIHVDSQFEYERVDFQHAPIIVDLTRRSSHQSKSRIAGRYAVIHPEITSPVRRESPSPSPISAT